MNCPTPDHSGDADKMVPPHYDKPVTPWDLQRHMESSGNAFVDARRTDAIEYCFRMKGDLLADLKKSAHCIQAAIEELEKTQCQFFTDEAPKFERTDGECGLRWIHRVANWWTIHSQNSMISPP